MSDSQPAPSRGRGRGNRGGLGKYLRARGRGRGTGRPAVFNTRLVLEGEETLDPESEEAIEAARIIRERFSKRQLGTNADRYEEPLPELDSDGEEILEPEIDLTAFLDKQLHSEGSSTLLAGSPTIPEDDPEDIDHSLANLNMGGGTTHESRKGKVRQVEWDEGLDDMQKEKKVAEASWDLKTRFRAKTERERSKPTPVAGHRDKKPAKPLMEAPPLPSDTPVKPKPAKDEDEDFLDDLLS